MSLKILYTLFRFPRKPEQEVIDQIKAAGGRWAKHAGWWYLPGDRRELAEQLTATAEVRVLVEGKLLELKPYGGFLSPLANWANTGELAGTPLTELARFTRQPPVFVLRWTQYRAHKEK